MISKSFSLSVRLAAGSLLLAAALQSRAATFQPAWSALGPAPITNGQTTTTSVPVSGRVTTIVVHPTSPEIAYVGTAQGGVYRTTNGGGAWTPLLDSAGTLAIGALKLAPSDPTTLFVGTGEPFNNSDAHQGLGLYVITNAETAPAVAGPFNKSVSNADIFRGNSISQILVSSSDANTILVSTNLARVGVGALTNGGGVARRGIYRSTNALSATPTFTLVTVLTSAFPGDRVFDLAADPADLNNLVCAIPQGIFRSANALSASPPFSAMFSPAVPFTLVRFAINKVGSTTTLLAVTSEAQGGFGVDSKGVPITKEGTLRRATYNGSAWSAFSAPIAAANGFADNQSFYDMGVAIDPTNANNIYIGGTASDFYGAQSGSFRKSTDAGATFTSSENGLHSDTHAIAVAPSNPARLYFGSDGGIWRSNSSGASWTSVNNSTFSATQFVAIALHPTDRQFMLGGTQDNGTEYLSSAGTWSQTAGGDGGACLIDQNAANTTNVTMYHTFYNDRGTQIGFEQRDSVNDPWVYRGFAQQCVDPQGKKVYCSNNGLRGADSVNFYAPMALGPGSPE